MTKNKKDKLGTVGFAKTIELQNLINTLNNTTVGNLNAEITALKNRCTLLESQVLALQSHTHTYEDTTIADTADGSGAASSTTKTTGGVS